MKFKFLYMIKLHHVYYQKELLTLDGVNSENLKRRHGLGSNSVRTCTSF